MARRWAASPSQTPWALSQSGYCQTGKHVFIEYFIRLDAGVRASVLDDAAADIVC
jgi:hypothetical protein